MVSGLDRRQLSVLQHHPRSLLRFVDFLRELIGVDGSDKRTNNASQAHNGYNQASERYQKQAVGPLSHILLGFQIVFGVLSFAGSIYGIYKTENAFQKGRIGVGDAFTGYVLGGVSG